MRAHSELIQLSIANRYGLVLLTDRDAPHAPSYPILFPLSLATGQAAARIPIAEDTWKWPDPLGRNVNMGVCFDGIDILYSEAMSSAYEEISARAHTSGCRIVRSFFKAFRASCINARRSLVPG